jgi:hypothetical protein
MVLERERLVRTLDDLSVGVSGDLECSVVVHGPRWLPSESPTV